MDCKQAFGLIGFCLNTKSSEVCRMDNRTSQFLPLGYRRLRLLGCLGGDSPTMPGYFDPAPDTDIFEAFRHYVASMSQKWAAETDRITISLLAAARVLTGDLDSAETIIDHLPVKAFKLDHGAGYCVVMPQTVLKTSLPLPSELTDIDCWLADSAEQSELRKWLKQHRDKLFWDEKNGIYQFPP
jgi:hypothetical protein